MQNVVELSHRRYAVVDMDSGTVLGTNVVLVEWPEDEDVREMLLSSDSAAFAYATENGVPLYANVEDEPVDQARLILESPRWND